MSSYIEGKRAVAEALKSGVPIERLFIADGIEKDGVLKEIVDLARRNDISVQYVDRKKIDSMVAGGKDASKKDRRDTKHVGSKPSKQTEDRSFSHQGVIAQAAPYRYASLERILDDSDSFAADNGGRALIVICDHITDAGNLGAIIRSAECVGASGVVIPNKRSAQVNATTYKTSAGAVAHMAVAQVPNIASALQKMKDRGFWVAGATEKADATIWATELGGKIALVMGNENEGISRLVLDNCDLTFKLPQIGAISSLNVAQSATASMYEWLRQNMQSDL